MLVSESTAENRDSNPPHAFLARVSRAKPPTNTHITTFSLSLILTHITKPAPTPSLTPLTTTDPSKSNLATSFPFHQIIFTFNDTIDTFNTSLFPFKLSYKKCLHLRTTKLQKWPNNTKPFQITVFSHKKTLFSNAPPELTTSSSIEAKFRRGNPSHQPPRQTTPTRSRHSSSRSRSRSPLVCRHESPRETPHSSLISQPNCTIFFPNVHKKLNFALQ